ncbi:MAG: glycosyltransferase family 4 protein [Phycisphaerales bacterium]|jgi:glycosyltransferase involved in cell wall biosynthesis|nr:glycosyltransferase family 4 protein [Phycisphaerales bacterium]
MDSGARRTLILHQFRFGTDHFRGVDAACADASLGARRVLPFEPPPKLDDSTLAAVVTDATSARARDLLREAARVGARRVLLMDGVVDFRNTFRNRVLAPTPIGRVLTRDAIGPDTPTGFLRPAPVDLIACASEDDAAVLRALGNEALATGLPRLVNEPKGASDHTINAPIDPRGIIVATATNPAFSNEERALLIEALRSVRDASERMRVHVSWRLTGGLARELDVPQDERPLAEALRDARAIILTPSTLLLEAKLAERARAARLPVGVLHPFGTPLWHAGDVLLAPRGTSDCARERTAEPHLDWTALDIIAQQAAHTMHHAADAYGLIDMLLSLGMESIPDGRLSDIRHEGAARRIVDELQTNRSAIALPAAPPTPTAHLHADARAARPTNAAASTTAPHILSCVACDFSAVGGVTIWSQRLGAALARRGSFRFTTLLILTDPDVFSAALAIHACDDHTRMVALDPTDHPLDAIATLERAIESLAPDLVLPNNSDIAYAAAMRLRTQGVRTIGIAHSDEDAQFAWLNAYPRREASIAVSRTCRERFDALDARLGLAHVPHATITYGVPIAPHPRTIDRTGPLRIAYIGRLVESQKRISDFPRLLAALSTRDVPFHCDIVGDGPQERMVRSMIDALPNARAQRTISMHGPRDPAWVQTLLDNIDVSVLVSEYEGTSIAMLEAMGRGVVPVVTRVRSGAADWIEDGVSGSLTEVGDVGAMADRVVELHHDRDRLAHMGAAAWERVRGPLSIDAMALQYETILHDAMRQPMDTRPCDGVCRLLESWRWSGRGRANSGAVDRIAETLRSFGFSRIRTASTRDDLPVADASACDALIVVEHASDELRREAAILRNAGIGVVLTPSLLDEDATSQLRTQIDRAARAGARRIAIYGLGRQTQSAMHALQPGPHWRGARLIGFIDDAPPAPRAMGLPVVTPAQAIEHLACDTIIINNRAYEQQMWDRTRVLRDAGVQVIRSTSSVYSATELVRGQPPRAAA